MISRLDLIASALLLMACVLVAPHLSWVEARNWGLVCLVFSLIFGIAAVKLNS